MDDEELLRMANQIAAFFTPYEAADARAGIAEHLRKFWSPAMREQLLALAEAGRTHTERGALHPLLSSALDELRAAPNASSQTAGG